MCASIAVIGHDGEEARQALTRIGPLGRWPRALPIAWPRQMAIHRSTAGMGSGDRVGRRHARRRLADPGVRSGGRGAAGDRRRRLYSVRRGPDWTIGGWPDPAALPANRPQAVARFGTTAEEQRVGESLDHRLSQEEPDVQPDDPLRSPAVLADEAIDEQSAAGPVWTQTSTARALSQIQTPRCLSTTSPGSTAPRARSDRPAGRAG